MYGEACCWRPFAAPLAVLCVCLPEVEAAFLGREAAGLADVRFAGADATEAGISIVVEFYVQVCFCNGLLIPPECDGCRMRSAQHTLHYNVAACGWDVDTNLVDDREITNAMQVGMFSASNIEIKVCCKMNELQRRHGDLQ